MNSNSETGIEAEEGSGERSLVELLSSGLYTREKHLIFLRWLENIQKRERLAEDAGDEELLGLISSEFEDIAYIAEQCFRRTEKLSKFRGRLAAVP